MTIFSSICIIKTTCEPSDNAEGCQEIYNTATNLTETQPLDEKLTG